MLFRFEWEMIVFNYAFIDLFIDYAWHPQKKAKAKLSGVNFSDSPNHFHGKVSPFSDSSRTVLCGRIFRADKRSENNTKKNPWMGSFHCEISTSVGFVSGFSSKQHKKKSEKKEKLLNPIFRAFRSCERKIERFNCGFFPTPTPTRFRAASSIIFCSHEILWIMSIKFYGIRV